MLKVTLMVVMGLSLENDRRRGYLFPGPAGMLPFLLSSSRTFHMCHSLSSHGEYFKTSSMCTGDFEN